MIVLLIISALLVTSFVGVAIWMAKALPESISSLVYVFKHKWLWTVWMWAVGFTTCIPAISALERIGMEFLGFGTLACLVFCAAMPIFMEEQKHWHDILGISSGVLSQLCVLMINPWWLIVWLLLFIIALHVYMNPDGKVAKVVSHKVVFIAECICYVSLEGSLI